MTLTKQISFPIYYNAAPHKEPALARWARRLWEKRREGSGTHIPCKEPFDGSLVWQRGEALGARNSFPGGRMG